MTDWSPRRPEVDRAEASADDGRPVAPGETDGLAATDLYETDDGVVLYDLDNPLAWVEAEAAIDLEAMA